MKAITIVLITFLCFTKIEGQNQASLRLHYFAYNYFHPGLEIGYELPIIAIQKTTKKDRQRWHQVYLAPNLGVYYHKRNHTGILLGSDLGLKTIGSSGFEMQIFGGAHYLRTQLANKTFEQQTNGSFEQIKGAGNNHFQWRAGLGFGKNFLPKQEKPLSINLKLGIAQQHFPGSPVVPNIWLGINYYL